MKAEGGANRDTHGEAEEGKNMLRAWNKERLTGSQDGGQKRTDGKAIEVSKQSEKGKKEKRGYARRTEELI